MQFRSFAFAILLAGLPGLGQVPFVTQSAGAARAAESPAQALSTAVLLPDMLDIMREEGRAYGEDLEGQFFPGAGGEDWARQVAAIYDPARLLPVFQATFAKALAQSGADPAPMLAFFASPLGRRIVTLELSARRALLEDSVDEAARQKMDEMRIEAPPRLQLLETYITANHLIDMNVASALNANLAFMHGLGAAGAFRKGLSEEELLAEVWSQEDAVRSETADWMLKFVILAYGPLEDAEVVAYTDFSRSPEGSALNRALFAGFDAVFAQVSNELGRAVGRWTQGTNL